MLVLHNIEAAAISATTISKTPNNIIFPRSCFNLYMFQTLPSYSYNMSTLTSCCLVFFLCLSLRLHACNARWVGGVNNNMINNVEKKVQFSFKNDTKNSLKKNIEVEVKSKPESIKEESMEYIQHDDLVGNKKGNAGSGAVRTDKSVVSISWRVPRRKRDEKNPGFNLDYAPPKTHPPHHN